MISHSFGGPCTLNAIQRGLKIERLVSIAPPATTMGLVDKFTHVLKIPEKAKHNLIQRFETQFGKAILDQVSMLNAVKELKIPGILFHDTHDYDIPWQEGHAVALEWDQAQFIKTSGLGHRRILKDAAVIDTTVDFITARSSD